MYCFQDVHQLQSQTVKVKSPVKLGVEGGWLVIIRECDARWLWLLVNSNSKLAITPMPTALRYFPPNMSKLPALDAKFYFS